MVEQNIDNVRIGVRKIIKPQTTCSQCGHPHCVHRHLRVPNSTTNGSKHCSGNFPNVALWSIAAPLRIPSLEPATNGPRPKDRLQRSVSLPDLARAATNYTRCGYVTNWLRILPLRWVSIFVHLFFTYGVSQGLIHESH